MLKINKKKNHWTPVNFDADAFASGADGLIGIEECHDYDLQTILGSNKKRKRKAGKCDNDDEVVEDQVQVENEVKSKKQSKKKGKKNKADKEVVTEEPLNEITKKKKKKSKNKKKANQNDKQDVIIKPSLSGGLDEIRNGESEEDEEEDEDNENGNLIKEDVDLTAWSLVPLQEPLLKALADQGFTKPTEIQSLTLPPAILGRRDILGAAETGSGKTLAFGLPILSGILKLKEEKNNESDNDDDGSDLEFDEEQADEGENEDTDTEEDENSELEFENDEEDEDNEEKLELCDELADLEIEEEENENSNENSDSNEEADGEEEDDYNENDEDDEIQDFNSDNEDFNEFQPQTFKSKSLKPLYALILTPTRELAVQIKNHLVAAAKYTDINIAVVVGGMAAVKQERVLKKGPEIVVATPGRLWELIEQGNPHLSQIDEVNYLAIDETDRMVEKGHFKELHLLLERMNMDAEKAERRQNFVFSATLTLVHELPNHLLTKKKLKIKRHVKDLTPAQKLQKLVETLGITNPKVVDITKGAGTSGTLTECRITCSIDEKDYYVYYFLKKHPGRTLIFCNSIGCVKRLNTLMGLLDCNVLPLHASMQQRQRLKNLDRFREKENSILIATDVAARGLDIPSVEHVLHYQMPRTGESYIHRSGRTARATKQGITILLIEPNEIQNYLRLCRTLGKSEDIPLFPIQDKLLNAVKERVNLARELDKLELLVRKSNSQTGWLEKAAKEMDILVDQPHKTEIKEANVAKKRAEIKRKQLNQLLAKPVFPKNFSGKFPLTLIADPSLQVTLPKDNETALETMKNAIENYAKITKNQKRKAKSLFKPKNKNAGAKVEIHRKSLINEKKKKTKNEKQKFKRRK